MKFVIFVSVIFCAQYIFAQKSNTSISIDEVSRIEKVLSADDMQGRAVFTPGIDKAADFISSEMKKAGLKPFAGNSFFQEFSLQKTKSLVGTAIFGSDTLSEKNIMLISAEPTVSFSNTSGYEKLYLGPRDTLYSSIQRRMNTGKNYIVFADTVHTRPFNGIKRFMSQGTPPSNTIVVILTTANPDVYTVKASQEISPMKLKNIVGVIPGKKLKDEYVIFSGHYDHLGIGKPDKDMDSIFNGANDDASGITAVLTLAKHFQQQQDNERSILFAAFTAEESGGYGSQHFSKQLDPAKVIAMFNIEMIGTESKWGNNSAFITGYEKSSMGTILEKNLEGSAFKFYPDPYPKQQLFYRSDNATLARLGVPAHTISTSKMDSEKHYHTVNDEFETLDMKNMTEIIKAIAISAKSIISGKDTPTRVDASQLR